MSRSRFLPPCIALFMVTAFGMAAAASPVSAQLAANPGPAGRGVKVKEPVASRVYQRDANGHAEIPIVLDESESGTVVEDATVVGPSVAPGTIKFVDGKLAGVPVGGPYTIQGRVQSMKADRAASPSDRSSWATSGSLPASRTWKASAT